MVALSSRDDEIATVIAMSHPYLDLSIEDLDRLFDEALEAADATGLPHRGVVDTSFWRQTLHRLRKEIAEQEVAASATVGYVAAQAVEAARSINLDLTDYNVPIAIFVALVVKAVWGQLRSGQDSGTDHDEQPEQ